MKRNLLLNFINKNDGCLNIQNAIEALTEKTGTANPVIERQHQAPLVLRRNS
jgi:hypothetical protein